jgi:hypothetical protein
MNGGSKLKISNLELKVYRILPLFGLLLLAATYLIRWKIDEPGVIVGYALRTMPNFCITISLPFMTLLILNKYKTGFLIKNKAKIFYSTMPLLTILSIVLEIIQLNHNKHTVDINDMIMSIGGMAVCIMIFEAINKPIVLASYKDITKPNKHAS